MGGKPRASVDTFALEIAASRYADSFVRALREHAPALGAPLRCAIFFIKQTVITPLHGGAYHGPRRSADVRRPEYPLRLDHGIGTIPRTTDETVPLLDAFIARHQLDAEEIWFGDTGVGALGGLYFDELDFALRRAVAELRAEGVSLTDDFEVALVDEDGDGIATSRDPSPRRDYLARTLSQLELPSELARREFAALSYVSRVKQQWLLEQLAR